MKVYNLKKNEFCVRGVENPDESKKIRWCLAKDDVTPEDIFRLTNEGSKERAIVGKYCIMDCRLVQKLMDKIDILTGFIEIAKIHYVPISFIVLRGQGIKLFSLIKYSIPFDIN